MLQYFIEISQQGGRISAERVKDYVCVCMRLCMCVSVSVTDISIFEYCVRRIIDMFVNIFTCRFVIFPYVPFVEYCFCYRALLQKRPIF